MAVKSDVKTGHDIAYVTRGHASGCAGAMACYTRTGDPPGTWEGRGCAALGVSGHRAGRGRRAALPGGRGPGRGADHPARRPEERRGPGRGRGRRASPVPGGAPVRVRERDQRRADPDPGHQPGHLPALLRRDQQRIQVGFGAARQPARGRGPGPGRRQPGQGRGPGRGSAGHRGRPARRDARRPRAARGHGLLRPHRPPLGHHGGVAGRQSPRRDLLAAHHQPGRGSPAARPPRRPQRRPARRRGRRRRGAPPTGSTSTSSGTCTGSPSTGPSNSGCWPWGTP